MSNKLRLLNYSVDETFNFNYSHQTQLKGGIILISSPSLSLPAANPLGTYLLNYRPSCRPLLCDTVTSVRPWPRLLLQIVSAFELNFVVAATNNRAVSFETETPFLIKFYYGVVHCRPNRFPYYPYKLDWRTNFQYVPVSYLLEQRLTRRCSCRNSQVVSVLSTWECELR